MHNTGAEIIKSIGICDKDDLTGKAILGILNLALSAIEC